MSKFGCWRSISSKKSSRATAMTSEKSTMKPETSAQDTQTMTQAAISAAGRFAGAYGDIG